MPPKAPKNSKDSKQIKVALKLSQSRLFADNMKVSIVNYFKNISNLPLTPKDKDKEKYFLGLKFKTNILTEV